MNVMISESMFLILNKDDEIKRDIILGLWTYTSKDFIFMYRYKIIILKTRICQYICLE